VVVHVVGRTDVGRTREHNEDAFAVADLATLRDPDAAGSVGAGFDDGERVISGGAVFMVADGMGGAAAGEIASSMAVDVVVRELAERWRALERYDPESFAAALRAATSAANARIHDFAVQHPEYRGMGTTATVAALLGDTLFLAQVGDSRAYLVRDGMARQITKDQSLMQKLIEAGEITAEEAEVSDRRNIILQALGPEAFVKVDLTHQKVRRGDTLILCSDGLSGQVRGDEIAQTVAEERDLERLCQRLIDSANASGGPDNITVVAARFDGVGLDMAASDDEVGHRVFPIGGDDTPVLPVERYVRRSMPSPAARRSKSSAGATVEGGEPGDADIALPVRRTIPLPWMIALLVVLVLALVYTLLQLRP
jgi:protein phosphatase